MTYSSSYPAGAHDAPAGMTDRDRSAHARAIDRAHARARRMEHDRSPEVRAARLAQVRLVETLNAAGYPIPADVALPAILRIAAETAREVRADAPAGT